MIRAASSTARATCASGGRRKTARPFNERTDCEVNEYGGFEAVPGQKVNGKLTLGENTADNGGLRIAYLALMDTLAAEGEGASHQGDRRLHSGAALLHRFRADLVLEQHGRVGKAAGTTDPHSPGKWRVNGTVQNFDEFGKAFGCKKGTPMYPEKSCRVW